MSKFDKFLACTLLVILLLSACVPASTDVMGDELPNNVNISRYVDTQYNNVCYYIFQSSSGVSISCVHIDDEERDN